MVGSTEVIQERGSGPPANSRLSPSKGLESFGSSFIGSEIFGQAAALALRYRYTESAGDVVDAAWQFG
jgi:hypothetical protein